jgi:tyrosine-protein phosphatase YwqE
VFNWFQKKVLNQPLKVDIHSHLLAGIDDGVKSTDEAIEIILQFQKLGYKKLITTPHVMSDVYRNTPDVIHQKLQELNNILSEKKIDVIVEAAAEYYLDETLFSKIERNEKLLTFGNKYLLFETNFMNEPFNLKEFIFLATTRGYKLVLAHPERYMYIHEQFKKAEDLFDRGVLFQINVSSISGFYSKAIQKIAFKLIDKNMVHWIGSDCHQLSHVHLLEKSIPQKYYQKALALPLLNNTLWSQ